MKWMLNCQEISQLTSDGLDRKLTWGERWLMRQHLSMCALCRRYRQQLQTLHQALAQMHPPQESQDSLGLSEPARQKIKQALHQAQFPESA